MQKFITASGRLVLFDSINNAVHAIRYINDRPTPGHTIFKATPERINMIVSLGSLSPLNECISR